MEVLTPIHKTRGQGWLSVNLVAERHKLNMEKSQRVRSMTSENGFPSQILIGYGQQRPVFRYVGR